MECLVIGLGVFGKAVAQSLKDEGAFVLGVDKNQQAIEEAANFLDETINIDTSLEYKLRQLGVENFDYCFVCIGVSMEASLTTTHNLNNLGATRIIARSHSKAHDLMLQKLGAYQIISPEMEIGRQIVQEISSGLDSFIKLKGDMAIITVKTPVKMVSKMLKHLSLRETYRVNVLWAEKKIPFVGDDGNETVYERDEEVLSGNYIFNSHDYITILGTFPNIKRFLNEFSDDSTGSEYIDEIE